MLTFYIRKKYKKSGRNVANVQITGYSFSYQNSTLSDLRRFTQIVLKFKTWHLQNLCFEFQNNFCKSDKISCQICWPDKEYITWKSSKLQQSQSAYIVSSSLKSYCKIRMLLYKSFNPIVLMTESSFCICLWLRTNIKNYIHCCEKSFIYPLQLVFEEKKIFAKVINLYDFMSQKAALRLKDNCMRV